MPRYLSLTITLTAALLLPAIVWAQQSAAATLAVSLRLDGLCTLTVASQPAPATTRPQARVDCVGTLPGDYALSWGQQLAHAHAITVMLTH